MDEKRKEITKFILAQDEEPGSAIIHQASEIEHEDAFYAKCGRRLEKERVCLLPNDPEEIAELLKKYSRIKPCDICKIDSIDSGIDWVNIH